MKYGFDNEKYLRIQSEHIKERISNFGNKLYLEFGGKLFDDYHASRVLPGFEPDTKMRLLQSLADDAEMKVTLIDGDRPEGRVDITTVQHEDRSAGVYVSFHGATSEDYDDIFNSTMEYAMHMYENRNDFSPTRFASGEDGEMAIVFIMQAREIMEDAGFPVEGFLAADVIFEPFTFEHNGELVLLGSEHFNGYNLFVEVKRLFIGATDAQKDEVAKKAMEGNDIEAIHCADASWSFRKPLCITDVDLFTEELLETVDTLLQAIGQVGEEPDGDEPRKEILRQMFTWEVLDAVAKYNQLPM